MLRIRFSGLYGLEIDDAAVAAAGTPGRKADDETDHRTALNHFDCLEAKRTYKMEKTDSRRSGLSLLLSRSQV
jgi:hypothetical protein